MSSTTHASDARIVRLLAVSHDADFLQAIGVERHVVLSRRVTPP